MLDDHHRKKVVLVAGDGKDSHHEKSELVGEWLAQGGFHLLTGGGGGVMAAVTRAFCESAGRTGLALGVIPGKVEPVGSRTVYRTKGAAYPNESIEVAIFTHLCGTDPLSETSRNHINVLSADFVVGLPGGEGTHAELQLARRYGKPTVLFMSVGESILGKDTTILQSEGFTVAETFPELLKAGVAVLCPERAMLKPVRLQLRNGIVRSWRWEDASTLPLHANNRKVWKNLHDGFPSPYTAAAARRWLAHALSTPDETVFAIESGGEAVGGIGFYLQKGPQRCSAEIGYWLGEAYWGRGLATDAVRSVTDYAFENYPGLQRLYAQVFEWNLASMRVLEKSGYTREALMHRSAIKNGEFIDVVLYSRVR
jgi:RimJ/RimL family protein N-acetyltransferase/predicted Rossmann-fold nucleotide-binding protein